MLRPALIAEDLRITTPVATASSVKRISAKTAEDGASAVRSQYARLIVVTVIIAKQTTAVTAL
jgi:hypothetical protein